jgi:hypothetical protein
MCNYVPNKQLSNNTMKKNFTNFIARTLVVCSVLLLASNAYAAVYIVGNFLNGWSNFVPMTAGANNEYSYSPVEANSEFKFTTQPGWSSQYSDSEKLFDESNPDNGQNEGVTISKNNNNLSIKLENGYGAPITFYVSTSNKTYWAKATKNGSPTTQNIYIPGDFNSWSHTGNQVDANGNTVISLAKNTYKFKIKVGDQWYGNGGTMTRTNCTDWGFDGNAGDAHIEADVPGDYIFKVTMSGGVPRLTVEYPSDALVDISLSKVFRYDSDIDPITLTATPVNATYTSYEWQVSTDKATWTTLGTSVTNTYQLTGNQLPNTTSFYRVIGIGTKKGTSPAACISVVEGCGEGTEMTDIFTMDFGTLDTETARKDLKEANMDNAKMDDEYDYREEGKKIIDGQYAIVATPYYTGCGDPTHGSHGDKEGPITDACLQERAWYRKYLKDGKTLMRDRDYINGKKPGQYGAMLMINFDDFKDTPIFTRELTDAEKGLFVDKARLCFSAWFACAAQPYDDVQQDNSTDIHMILSIQYSADGGVTWVDGQDENGNSSKLETKVTFEEDWVCLSTDLQIPNKDYKYRIIVTNQNKSGVGNDVLIDDIQLHLCKPSFNVYFEDKKGDLVEDFQFAKVDTTTTFVVKNQNFGSITNPCVMVFEKRGTRYGFIGNMDFNAAKDRFELTKSNADLIETLPQTFEYVAVVSAKTANDECDVNVQTGVINGTIQPGQNPTNVFSDNTIAAQVGCGNSKLSNPSDITKICVATDDDITLMPVLALECNHVGSGAKVDILVDGQSFVSGLEYKEGANGYMELDLNKLYEDANGAPYKWEIVGQRVIAVNVTETFKNQSWCEHKATGEVKINVVARPTVKTLVSAVFQNTTCEGESTILAVTADNAIAYQWEMLAPNTTNWVKVGSGADTLQTSLGMLNETQYRVKLENDPELHCGIVSDPITMYVKACDDLTLSQYVTTNVCKGDTIAYTINLKNHAAGNAYNVEVNADWDNAKLVYEKANAPEGTSFDADTKVWTVGTMKSKQELSLTIFMVLKDESQASYEVKSFVSKLNETIAGEYDRQSDPNMKGTSEVVLNGKAPNPVPKRKQMENAKDEIFSYNQCPIAKIVKFDELIKGDGFDMTLVWVDAEGNLIENPSFDANVPIEDGVAYVYNAPEGLCQSDIIEVHYRVKKVTPVPVVTPYEACALTGTAEEVQLSLMDRIKHPDGETYKYVAFYDEKNVEVTSKTFDASKPGTTTYTVKVSMDEINSQSNNYCEAQATFTVTVKAYAVSAEIIANGTSVCPNTSATLTASSSVSGAVYHWHQLKADGEYHIVSTGATYTTPALTEAASYKVTVTGTNLCEQAVDAGKSVDVNVLTKITDIELTPAVSDFVIGGNDVKTLTITPSNAVYNTIWTANGKPIDVETDGHVQNTIEKTFVDTEYRVEVIGECSRDTLYATTTVVWPTVFTPYVLDGLNDTFVQDMNPNFPTLICNRFGMPLVETKNGWDGKLADGRLAVPGVYYYVVTLPDGSIKKGTIEVFKK